MPVSLEDLLRETQRQESALGDFLSQEPYKGKDYGAPLRGLGQLAAGFASIREQGRKRELMDLLRKKAQQEDEANLAYKKAQTSKEVFSAVKMKEESEKLHRENEKKDAFSLISSKLLEKNPDWTSLLSSDPELFQKAGVEVDPMTKKPKTLQDEYGATIRELPARYQVLFQHSEKVAYNPDTKEAFLKKYMQVEKQLSLESSRSARGGKEKDPNDLLKSAHMATISTMNALGKLRQDTSSTPEDVTQRELQREILLNDFQSSVLPMYRNAFKRMGNKDAETQLHKIEEAVNLIGKKSPEEKEGAFSKMMGILGGMVQKIFVSKAQYDQKFLSSHPSNISKKKNQDAAKIVADPDSSEFNREKTYPKYVSDTYPDPVDYIDHLVENFHVTPEEAVKIYKDQQEEEVSEKEPANPSFDKMKDEDEE